MKSGIDYGIDYWSIFKKSILVILIAGFFVLLIMVKEESKIDMKAYKIIESQCLKNEGVMIMQDKNKKICVKSSSIIDTNGEIPWRLK